MYARFQLPSQLTSVRHGPLHMQMAGSSAGQNRRLERTVPFKSLSQTSGKSGALLLSSGSAGLSFHIDGSHCAQLRAGPPCSTTASSVQLSLYTHQLCKKRPSHSVHLVCSSTRYKGRFSLSCPPNLQLPSRNGMRVTSTLWDVHPQMRSIFLPRPR